MSLPVHCNRESSNINAFNLQKNNIYTQKSSGYLAHTKESAAAIQKQQIIHVGGCPAHTLKNKSYETVAIVTHKHLPNKQ